MHENIGKKIKFIKIVFVSISINKGMVLKWKLGQLVRIDLIPLKRISFTSTPSLFDSTVIPLSRDIVHKVEKLTFAGKSRQLLLFSQTDIIRQATYFRFLLLSFLCFLTDYLIGRNALHHFPAFIFIFSSGLSDWLRSHCIIFAVQFSSG